jgi:hypothetical protein
MKANRYHINSAGEAMPCTAKVRCRFGGESGVENHFDTAEAAQIEVQNRLQKEFSQVSSVRRGAASTQFIKSRENIKSALVSYGVVKNDGQLVDVDTTEEMVREWFDGDISQYQAFKKVSENEEISSETKKSVGNFVKQGLPVTLSSSVHEVPHSRSKGMFEGSEIDLLEDIPDSPIDLESIRNGSLKAFL